MTTVQVMRGVYLTPLYTDVMTFGTGLDRDYYFSKKVKFTFESLVPVRDNTVRVPIPVDELWDTSYLRYQNANFNNKWFYCFIIDKKWINAHCCEITLMTDVITTWEYDWELKASYVERMHVGNDKLGDWPEPEPLEFNKKIMQAVGSTGNFIDGGLGAVIFYVPADGKLSDPNHMTYANIYCACNKVYYPESDFQKMYDDIIQPLLDLGLSDNIIAIQMVPAIFKTGENAKPMPGTDQTYYIDTTIGFPRFSNLEGYEPANKKLLCYPYNSLVVASSEGTQNEYMLEEFNAGLDPMTFRSVCSLTTAPAIIGDFIDYGNKRPLNERPNPARQNVIKNFPMGLYSGLSGLAYIQNVISSTLGATVNSAAGLLGQRAENSISNLKNSKFNLDNQVGNFIESTASNFGLTANLVSGAISSYLPSKPAMTYGSAPSSATAYNLYGAAFIFNQYCINNNTAYAHDCYLTRFGYAVNNTRVPAINNRERFNYIKTNGLIIRGDIPAEDLAAIKNIFDKGVTFWHAERDHEIGDWDGDPHKNGII